MSLERKGVLSGGRRPFQTLARLEYRAPNIAAPARLSGRPAHAIDRATVSGGDTSVPIIEIMRRGITG